MPSRDTHAILSTWITHAVVNFGTMLAFPTQRTGTGVIVQGLQGASPSVSTGAVSAGIVGDGDFTKGGLVTNGTSTLECWSSSGRHHH